MKILSADDSVLMRRIIRNAVEMLGYELVEACDGREALVALDREYADIVLVPLDWNMPNVDGYTVLTEMQKDERFRNIPAMMVTTETERVNVVQAIAAGAKNYLMKPFQHEELVAKIMQCLGLGA